MRVIVCDNYNEISEKAAQIIAGQIYLKPNCVLGLATGSTPVGMYTKLAEMYNAGKLDFSDVVTFNLDEYYPIKKSNSQSYDYFMNEQLFSKVNIQKHNVHIPNGETESPEEECGNYDAQINAIGGVDVQILGIGVNGHIGFNEPDSELISGTHITALTESTVKANSRFFESEADVPTKALTMGIATILKAKKIVLLASGKNKYDAVKALLSGNITTSVPATLLNVHNDVVVICDKEAYYGDAV